MKRTLLRPIVLTVVAILLSANFVSAGSIWARSGRKRAPHTDDTARAIGDVLTIIIDEHSVVENETSRIMSKSSKRTAKASGELALLNLLGTFVDDEMTAKLMDLALSTAFKKEHDGLADYDRDRWIADKMTVTVTDVLPNGNLVVVGSRDRKVAGDTETVQISGVIRPSDITFANTVSSEKVAEFKIVMKKSGIENNYIKFNLFDWLFDLVNLY